MFYGYHQALCLQRLKGDVFMDSGSLLHYLHSSEIISLSFFNSPILSPYLYCSFNKAAVFVKERGENKMNPHYTKGTKWTDFQPWIVSKWMIIWLISEINNNNCLSLLIRLLHSKWNSSAEFQRAGFSAENSVLSWKKRGMTLCCRCPCANP